MQKDVAILLRIGGATGRNILAGILKRIKDRDNCTIRIASDADDFQRLASSAAALIADSSASLDTIQTAIADNKPVVLLNDWRVKDHPANLGHIRTDDGEIGFKAADYLRSLGKFRAFGYVPAHTDREWSVKRGRAFQLRLRRNGCECRMFDSAVFCAWDAVTADVAFAARKAKVKIPSQVVLLGVDNDETYCTSTSPQISSIEFDAEREGRMAAELMLKMLKSRKPGVSRIICCGTAKRIVERESTRPPAPAAFLVEQAMKYISENATKGIGPGDVADHLGISRTLLDLRFRETGNVSVGRLILEHRLNALAALIAKSRYPLLRAISQCGFGSINHAKAVFKKRFGMTMREYRNGQTKP